MVTIVWLLVDLMVEVWAVDNCPIVKTISSAMFRPHMDGSIHDKGASEKF